MYYSELEISITSVCMAVSLICGWRLWRRRGDAPDRSRTYLSIIDFLMAAMCGTLLLCVFFHYRIFPPWALLGPIRTLGGLYSITLFLHYPIEVMHPRQLRGRWMLLLWLPSILVTLPFLCGLPFQEMRTWSDLGLHLTEWNVLLRLVGIAFIAFYSVLLLVIPYNWRKSSADYRWVRRAAFLAQVTSILYFGHVFTNQHVFMSLHLLWCTLSILYFTYYEIHLRVLPSSRAVQRATSPSSPVAVNAPVDATDFWPVICQVMDQWEAWRNPNTTVETVSTAVGTNRIYVARCIKEHTGLTFNDYMNEKRIRYMAAQLRLNPAQDHKQLYFDVGFRSRHTAYRNFVKFIGSSPTDFIASVQPNVTH